MAHLRKSVAQAALLLPLSACLGPSFEDFAESETGKVSNAEGQNEGLDDGSSLSVQGVFRAILLPELKTQNGPYWCTVDAAEGTNNAGYIVKVEFASPNAFTSIDPSKDQPLVRITALSSEPDQFIGKWVLSSDYLQDGTLMMTYHRERIASSGGTWQLASLADEPYAQAVLFTEGLIESLQYREISHEIPPTDLVGITHLFDQVEKQMGPR